MKKDGILIAYSKAKDTNGITPKCFQKFFVMIRFIDTFPHHTVQ